MAIVQEALDVVAKGENFAAIEVGPLSQLDSYKLNMPAVNRTVRGKLFIQESLNLTGMEISLNKFPAGAAMPFYHKHKENEEVYLIVSGKGQMQIDGQTFDVKEGSIVRVAPDGSRVIRNNSTEDLIYLCIQAKEGSLNHQTIEDGVRVENPVVW